MSTQNIKKDQPKAIMAEVEEERRIMIVERFNVVIVRSRDNMLLIFGMTKASREKNMLKLKPILLKMIQKKSL